MSRWKRIVVHHSAGNDTDELNFISIRNAHVRDRGFIDIGYHFVVEEVEKDTGGTGEYVALCGRPLNFVGAHAKGANGDSIGVCFVGDYTAAEPPLEMLVAGAKLIAGLFYALGLDSVYDQEQKRYRKLNEVIVPHRGAGTTATECPGDSFPLAKLLDLVREYLGAPE